MALEVFQTILNVHEDSVTCIAFDKAKKAVYTIAEGDKAIKAWDLKTGSLLRTQSVHRGAVTAVCFAPSARLLFSAAVDATIGVWSDKGTLLQLVPTGGPIFSLAWCDRRRLLVAGGDAVLHLFGADLQAATRLRHACHAAQAAGAGSRGSGAAGQPTCLPPAGDAPPVLRRLCPPFRGRRHPTAAAGATSSKGGWDPISGAAMVGSGEAGVKGLGRAATAPPEATDAAAGGGEEPQAADAANAHDAVGARDAAVDQIIAGSKGAREEDYYSACHTDVVKCIVISAAGKIFTGGFDRAICIYDTEKLDKGRECFKRIRDCARAAITSLALDPKTNVLLAGSLEGCLRVWSLEGRCIDKFEGLGGAPVSVVHVPHAGVWWVTGRFDRVNVCDPRAPANVTPYVARQNHLLKHQVELLYAPPSTDLVLAATRDRGLVAWQYNASAAHRVFPVHEDWVEGLVAARTGSDPLDERLYTFCADGRVRSWELDVEQGCDVYRLLDDIPIAPTNVRCLVYQPDRDCLIAGCDDGVVRLHFASGLVPTCNDMPLPTVLPGHEGAVLGVALVGDARLLTAGHDGTVRLWDLSSMKQLLSEAASTRGTPVTCLEWCGERHEAGVCATSSKAYIWSFQRPTQPRLQVVLDHSEHANGKQRNGQNGSQGETGEEDQAAGSETGLANSGAVADAAALHNKQKHGPVKPSNMRWLTRSDLEGLPQPGEGGERGKWPALVAEAIRDAAVDVPEVTQIRWAAFLGAWVTAADDGALRTWTPAGRRQKTLPGKGGRIGCLHIDEARGLLLAAAADCCVYVFDPEEPVPVARYAGHEDAISAICSLSALNYYMTASWDGSVRLWPRPAGLGRTGSSAAASATGSATGRSGGLLREDSGATEAAAMAAGVPESGPPTGPLQAGASVARARGMRAGSDALPSTALGALRSSDAGSMIGEGPGSTAGLQQPSHSAVLDTEAAAGSVAGGADSASEVSYAIGPRPQEPPGSLGAKLTELGRQLLHNIDAEFDEKRRATGERLGACYVAAAAEAAAAAAALSNASVSRGGSFVAPMMLGSLQGGGLIQDRSEGGLLGGVRGNNKGAAGDLRREPSRRVRPGAKSRHASTS